MRLPTSARNIQINWNARFLHQCNLWICLKRTWCPGNSGAVSAGSPKSRQLCPHLLCKVSMKQCMLECRNWCGFGGRWASCRWLCAKPTPFFLDSQSAQDLALNTVFHKRSKRTAIKFHWVHEHVNPDGEYRTAKLIHVRTKDSRLCGSSRA